MAGPGPAFAQTPAPSLRHLDLTHNMLVNDADAWKLVSAWNSLYQDGRCFATVLADRDIDRNGCIDVADLQQLLAHWGEPADSSVARPTSPEIASHGPFVVNSRGDAGDANLDDGECRTSNGDCTLRAAVEQANANSSSTQQRIEFNIRNVDNSCPGVVTIDLNSEIDIEARNGVVIDGYTQCNAQPNTSPLAGNAVIKIQLRGKGQLYVDGLVVKSGNNVIRGMAIYFSDRQIVLLGRGGNRVEGNFIGTDVTNTERGPILEEKHSVGIWFYNSSNNIIGGATPAARNIVAGNRNDGIHVQHLSNQNRIIGNFIGLKQDGRTALRNSSDGIDFEEGPQYNWLGGTNPGERNIISGNGSEGIEISHNSLTRFNHVAGNYFGLTVDGRAVTDTSNRSGAVSLEDEVYSNYVHDNVLSNNGAFGVRFYVLASYNQIYRNKIGVGPDGVTPMPNGRFVDERARSHNNVMIMGESQHNQIFENIIANGPESGIMVSMNSDDEHGGFGETFFNTISKNSIYNNADWGIRLDEDRGERANQGIPAPLLLSANTAAVAGRACANCKVEIFIADKTVVDNPTGDNAGEGKTFIGEAVADAAGNFVAPVSNVAVGQIVTGTATDGAGNTSEFARNVAVGAAPPPTPTPTGTLTPVPTTEPTISPTTEPTTSPTTTPTVNPTPDPTPTSTPRPTPRPVLNRTFWVPLIQAK